MACAATSSSRAPDRPRFRAAAMAARRLARCCANTWSARRWRRSAFRPRARSPPSITGESVMRETPLPGAVLTRVAVEPHPRRHLPVFRGARRYRRRAAARRSRHRASLSTGRRLRSPLSHASGGRDRAAGRAGRALAAGRLHPRRHEYRQHLDIRRDHRLRPVRLHGPIRSGDGVQLDRRAGPLRLCQPAADRALEPDAASPNACCRCFPANRTRRSPRRRPRSANSQSSSMPPIRPVCAASSGCSRRATAIRRWRRICWMRWPGTRPTSR